MRTYSTEEAAILAGASFRQCDYWTRAGIIRPSGPTLHRRHGLSRRWTSEDIARLRTVRQIMELGGKRHDGTTAAKVAMRHWNNGTGWLVVAPATGQASWTAEVEKVPKAIRRVGGRALVVPLP